ncbi:hypothetical protein D046_1609B, partial [Vibrio parahaemolyticus V-223/04]
ETLRMWLD